MKFCAKALWHSGFVHLAFAAGWLVAALATYMLVVNPLGLYVTGLEQTHRVGVIVASSALGMIFGTFLAYQAAEPAWRKLVMVYIPLAAIAVGSMQALYTLGIGAAVGSVVLLAVIVQYLRRQKP